MKMTNNFRALLALPALLLSFTFTACSYQERSQSAFIKSSTGISSSTGVGMSVGAVLSSLAETSVPVGLVAGAATGGPLGILANTQSGLTYRIVNSGIPVINYGENTIVVLPSDRIFNVGSSVLYPEADYLLNFITTLVKSRPHSAVTIAAYSDDVGSYQQNRFLTQHQADRVLSHFWSHGVDFHRVRAVGYGFQDTVASNYTSLGSQFNRRVEIRIHPETV